MLNKYVEIPGVNMGTFFALENKEYAVIQSILLENLTGPCPLIKIKLKMILLYGKKEINFLEFLSMGGNL